jgi:hypothetical protein
LRRPVRHQDAYAAMQGRAGLCTGGVTAWRCRRSHDDENGNDQPPYATALDAHIPELKRGWWDPLTSIGSHAPRHEPPARDWTRIGSRRLIESNAAAPAIHWCESSV